MIGEIVSVVTQDKVKLDGFYSQSVEPVPVARPAVDAAVIVHGLSGNFYQSRLLKHFAFELSKMGIGSLLVNTRGHDYLNSTPRMGRATTMGSAVEIIDECRFDLTAWTDFLVQRGHQRILLLGHSLGAIKSLYCQAHQPHPNVAGIAAFSATKLSYDSLLSSTGGDRFSHWLGVSQQMVSNGDGPQLLFVDFPFPTWMSADAYLNKYGNGDRYNWLSFMDRIDVPALTVFGEIEINENPAFMAMADDLSNIKQSNFQVRIVAHADHFYSARFKAGSTVLVEWLSGING